jgi:hypothetical protein
MTMTTDDNVIHMEYLKEFYAKFPTPAQTAMAQVSALSPSAERCQRTLDRLATCLECIVAAKEAHCTVPAIFDRIQDKRPAYTYELTTDVTDLLSAKGYKVESDNTGMLHISW